MKVVCRDSGETQYSQSLTFGKIYDTLEGGTKHLYLMKDNLGREHYFSKGRFISLREDNLNKLV